MHAGSITLTAEDLARIRRAQLALLSPLDHSGLDVWRAECVRAVGEAVGAGAGAFHLPLTGGAAIFSQEYQPGPAHEYPQRMEDVLPHVWERQVELQVHTEQDVWLPVGAAFLRTAYYNEVKLPVGAVNAGGMTSLLAGEASPGSCAQLLAHRGPGEAQGDRERAIYSLLFPAFASGCATAVEISGTPLGLLESVDVLDMPLLLTDLGGTVLHRNRALRRLLGGEPEAGLLEAALAASVWELAAQTRLLASGDGVADRLWDRTVEAGDRRYRIRSTLLRAGTPGCRTLAMVTVTVPPRLPEAPGAWSAEWGLTPRETEVAVLLARGRSNKAIARELGIRPKTARRHTERVLRKLDVVSRSQVAVRILSASA